MSLVVSSELINATQHPALKRYRAVNEQHREREVEISSKDISSEVLNDLIAAAKHVDDKKADRAFESILSALSGKFDKPVPSFTAFKGVLESFLKHKAIDGWLYATGNDGLLYPHLVMKVVYDDGKRSSRDKPQPTVSIHTMCYGFKSDGNRDAKIGVYSRTFSFYPGAVVRRRIADILAEEGIYKETPALREEYQASIKRHRGLTQDAFAQQFRVSGRPYAYDDPYRRNSVELINRRVVHDLEPKDFGVIVRHGESYIFEGREDADDAAVVPEHPVVKVFDLQTHEFFWVHADNMTPYVYNKSLRDKLILPESHRDLLDVLTTDIGAFVQDFIEGKSAGNVILCKGVPGVGKTLTAEVYAELIDRPLYMVHSGELGTTADKIQESLEEIFQRGKRWDCVLLLDEADVFVVQRGNNIEQNAIVAEFLRALEYFDGLLFMTTNRPDDIDDAIISRCAAIIDYSPPTEKAAAAIWRVMATQFEAKLDDDMVDKLVSLFPGIAARDIKMLFRLALRVSLSKKQELTLDTFRMCAMFRAIKMKTGD